MCEHSPQRKNLKVYTDFRYIYLAPSSSGVNKHSAIQSWSPLWFCPWTAQGVAPYHPVYYCRSKWWGCTACFRRCCQLIDKLVLHSGAVSLQSCWCPRCQTDRTQHRNKAVCIWRDTITRGFKRNSQSSQSMGYCLQEDSMEFDFSFSEGLTFHLLLDMTPSESWYLKCR